MYLLYALDTGNIRQATDLESLAVARDDSEGVVEVDGSAEQDADGAWLYDWPHSYGPGACAWDGEGIVVADNAPSTVPETISRRQLVLALLSGGWIDTDEAEAWAAGSALPATILTAIATLDSADQTPARVTLLSMDLASRTDSLATLVAGAVGAGDDDIDAVWTQGAAL